MELRTEQEIVERVRELCPCRDDAEAREVLAATLEVLGEQLFDEERAFLARDLPPEIGTYLDASRRRTRGRAPRKFFRRVALREGIRPSLGVEHAEVVCRVLAETLPGATLERLRREVPELAELFVVPEEPEAPPSSERLSEPAEVQRTDRSPYVHHHSVAGSSDPHAKTRIASARGLSQEREERTLAAGHPGSDRPLSSGR